MGAPYPNQVGGTIRTGTSPGGVDWAEVYIEPPGAGTVDYRRFRMRAPLDADLAATPPVMWILHGLGGDEDTWFENGVVWDAMINAFTDQGWPVVSPRSGDQSWGNPASRVGHRVISDWIDSVFTDSVGSLIYGTSMGGFMGLSIIDDNYVNVLGWVGNSPPIDLHAIFDSGKQASVRTAYGFVGDFDEVATAGFDMMDEPAATFRELPMRMYASYTDTSVDRNLHADPFLVKITGTAVEAEIVTFSGGHTSAPSFQPVDTIAFFERCLAYTGEDPPPPPPPPEPQIRGNPNRAAAALLM